MSLFRNARTLLSDSDVRHRYLKWCLRRAVGRYPLVTLGKGARIATVPRFNDYYAVAKQHPSTAEIALYRTLLRPNQVFVDVGANVGVYSILAYSIAPPSRILAFEPSHRHCAVWHENVTANGVQSATLLQAAVSDAAGTALFLMSPKLPANNRLVTGEAAADRYTTSVSTVMLDAICADFAIQRIGFLKVDVEGAEPKVLRGATRLLNARAIDVIYLEFIVEFMEQLGEDPYEFVAALDGFGYEFFEILPAGVLGRKVEPRSLVDARRISGQPAEPDFAGLNVVVLPRK
jgi:FkbM family methyltransferase